MESVTLRTAGRSHLRLRPYWWAPVERGRDSCTTWGGGEGGPRNGYRYGGRGGGVLQVHGNVYREGGRVGDGGGGWRGMGMGLEVDVSGVSKSQILSRPLVLP